jgi:hypothetical protein
MKNGIHDCYHITTYLVILQAFKASNGAFHGLNFKYLASFDISDNLLAFSQTKPAFLRRVNTPHVLYQARPLDICMEASIAVS